MPNPAQRPPMKLYLVFLFGFLASVVVVGGLIYAFAAYETGNPWPLVHDPRLSQDKWFEVIRNAVTTGAALGVGITLFFSYRRQQTAEQTQQIGSEAQLTAAKAQATAAAALDLSNKQHALDQDRRKDSVTTELRTRYAKTAEQLASDHLAVRLAGVYSLAALADDWAEAGNDDERQVCIDLLCAYFRSEQPGENVVARRELAQATLQVISERIRTSAPEPKFWGGSRIRLKDPGQLPSVSGITLNQGGRLSILGATLKVPAPWRNIELFGGHLYIENLHDMAFQFSLQNSWLAEGILSVSVKPGVNARADEPPRLHFEQVTLAGANILINASGADVVFDDCVFKGGSMTITTRSAAGATGGEGSVTFNDCLFQSDMFASSHWGPKAKLETGELVIKDDCRFENGATVLQSFVPGGV